MNTGREYPFRLGVVFDSNELCTADTDESKYTLYVIQIESKILDKRFYNCLSNFQQHVSPKLPKLVESWDLHLTFIKWLAKKYASNYGQYMMTIMDTLIQYHTFK